MVMEVRTINHCPSSCIPANTFQVYVGGRFVLGFGNSLTQLSSPVLLTEICHPQHRGRITAVYNCLWNLGALCEHDFPIQIRTSSDFSLVVAWIAWATMTIHSDWSWRTLTILQVVPAVIQLTFIYCKQLTSRQFFHAGSRSSIYEKLISSTGVPESPRWHIAKDRPEEALATLAHYHANGDINDPTVQFEYQEIKETLRLEFEFKKTSSYMDFLKTKGNRYRLAILLSLGIISQYSGNALFSNYMNLIYNSMGITKQSQKIPVSFCKYYYLSKRGSNYSFLSLMGAKLYLLSWSVLDALSWLTALVDGHYSSLLPLVSL
jgi:MFS family permease